MPVAVSKAQELHERASALEWGEVDAAMALHFQLKAALRRDAGNLALRDALIAVCRIIGYRDEAIEHLEVLDRSWMLDGIALAFNTQGQLVQLGFADRGLARAKQLSASLPALHATEVENLVFTAELMADHPLLDKLAALGSLHARAFLAQIMALPVGSHLAHLQSLALKTAAPYMMGAMMNGDDDPETGVSRFTTTFFIDGSLIHASDLFDRIHEAQGQYAAGFPDQGADWWPHYFVDVKAAPRHHSIPAKARLRKAA